MDEVKTQPCVFAEFKCKVPDGRTFAMAYLTLQFCANNEAAKHNAKKISDDFVTGVVTEHTECLKRSLDTFNSTIANGCKLSVFVYPFFCRIEETPKPSGGGWGK